MIAPPSVDTDPIKIAAMKVQDFLDNCISCNVICGKLVLDVISDTNLIYGSDRSKYRQATDVMHQLKGWVKAKSNRTIGGFTAIDQDGNVMTSYGNNGRFSGYGKQYAWIRVGSSCVNIDDHTSEKTIDDTLSLVASI